MSKKKTTPDVIVDKDVELKGASTVPDEETKAREAKIKELNKTDFDNIKYKQPENLSEALLQRSSSGVTAGTSGFVFGGMRRNLSSQDITNLIQPVDLARGIPDPLEREAFIRENGQKLINLVDLNEVAINFKGDLGDAYKYKERNYHKNVKAFIDDLDENQGFISEMSRTISKITGKTALNVAGVIPAIYGVGSAIANLDASKVFDNSWFDAWEMLDQQIDKYTFVYGGSDIWETDPETGGIKIDANGQPVQKDFFARVGSDPIRFFNAEAAPAISFVAGAVVTELAAAGLAPFTAGASLAVNTARLGGQATKLFSKGYRAMKGLTPLTKFGQGRKYIQGYQAVYKNSNRVMKGLRSSALESSLIARSTQDQTLARLVENHRQAYNLEPTEADMRRYEAEAKKAGTLAYSINTPLVAGSNFIQFSKLFNKNYAMSTGAIRRNMNRLDPNAIGGTRFVNGKRIANIDAADFSATKYWKYTKAAVQNPLTEAFEEFSQGALEEGLVDYYGARFSGATAREQISFINAMANASKKFLNSDEGTSSIFIGGVMGLLGLRLPVYSKRDDGTYRLGFKAFGGSMEEIRGLKSEAKEAKDFAEQYNKRFLLENVILRANFQAHFNDRRAQENADAAAVSNDPFEFKNAEFDQMFALIQNRASLGIIDSVFQDFEDLRNMPLSEFNKLYGSEEIQFTAVEREQALKKAEERAKKIVKNISEVREVVEHRGLFKNDLVRKLGDLLTDKTGINRDILAEKFGEEVVEQLSYLRSVVDNTEEREQALMDTINSKASIRLDSQELDKMAAELSSINNKTKRAEFKEKIREKVKEAKEEWKKEDPVNYKLYGQELNQSIDDIADLKIRRAQAAEMYSKLLTDEGLKKFTKIKNAFEDNYQKELDKAAKENIAQQAAAKRNASLNNLAAEEEALFGNSDITDAEAKISILRGISKYKQNRPTNPEVLTTKEKKEAIQFLDKHPGLLAAVVNSLRNKGRELTQIKTVADLEQVGEISEDIYDDIFEALDNILNFVTKIEEAGLNRKIFDDFEDESQPTVDDSATEGAPILTIEEYEQVEGGKTILLVTHDKRIPKSKEDTSQFGENGKVADHKNKAKELDSGKINAPEFLNNDTLKTGLETAVFEIPNTEYNRDPKRTASDLRIDVYHVDKKTGKRTFLGMLPSVGNVGQLETTAGSETLTNLRKAIVTRHNVNKIKKKKDTKTSQQLQEEIAELENQLKDLETGAVESAEDQAILETVRKSLKEEIEKNNVNLTEEQVDSMSLEQLGQEIQKICKK